MTWDREEDRLALLELYATGELKRRRSQLGAWGVLSEARWTVPTGRVDDARLADHAREDLKGLLARVWPEFEDVLARLASQGLPPTERGWKALLERDRIAALGSLPLRLNRRTAIAQIAPSSKSTLTPARRAVLGDVDLRRDGIVRMRPNPGLVVARHGYRLETDILVALTGEVVISERAFVDGTTLSGTLPRAVLTVENQGTYLDVAAPSDWLVVHVPGWNTATLPFLLEQMSAFPIVHFGDLDPAGVGLVRHLRSMAPSLGWLVPPFWAEYVEHFAQRARWPTELDLADAPALVRELSSKHLWLEQEAISLDPRLLEVLGGLVAT